MSGAPGRRQAVREEATTTQSSSPSSSPSGSRASVPPLHHIEPGKPWQNGYGESFHARLPDELNRRLVCNQRCATS